MGNTHDTEIARIEADHIQTKWKTIEDYRWGYTGERGTDTWWIHFPSASGGKQSPIDICTEDTNTDAEIGNAPIQVDYYMSPPLETMTDEQLESSETKILVNTGATARLNIVNSQSYIVGGPCKSYSYVLEQIHLHWGESDSSGSEHYIDSMPFAAELHLVHWNEDLYNSYEEAARSDDGILIFAVLIKISETKSNSVLNELSTFLEEIQYREQNIPLPRELPVVELLPEDIDKYWTYQGSFCTPPCYETVTWVVFETPIFISSKVLQMFRELKCYGENETRPDDEHDGEIVINRRPYQPIGARKVIYIDCDQYRDIHEIGDGRPFRGINRSTIGGSSLGLRLAALHNYVSKYSRDGLHSCSRGG